MILPGLTLHAIFLFKVAVSQFVSKHIVILAMETIDNQLDFSMLEVRDVGTT